MMKCPHCGALCADDDKFCSLCGTDMSRQMLREQGLPAVQPVEIDPVVTEPIEARVERTISETRKKKSYTCVIGFIISVVFILASIAFWIFEFGNKTLRFRTNAPGALALLVLVLLPVGFILSLVGTIAARKSKSRKYGITGLCLTVAGFIGGIVMWNLLFSDVTDKYDKYVSGDVRIDEYDVRRQQDDPLLATAVKYYWDGDPSHVILRPDLLSDGTKITSIGEVESFEIVLEPGLDYLNTHDYLDTAPFFNNRENLKNNLDSYGIKPGTVLNFSNITFYVELGKDIEQVEISKYGGGYLVLGSNDAGTITFYKYSYHFRVDPENTNYYAEDGILYDKRTNKIVDAIYYDGDDSFEEWGRIYKPELVPTEEPVLTETTSTPRSPITFGTGSEKINLWSYSDEVPNMVRQYIKLNPEFGEKYTVECMVFPTDDGLYQNELDKALAAGGDNAPDIYVAEQAFIIKYTKGSMSKFAATYNDLGINVKAKVKEADIAQYTVDVGSRNGEIVALGYQSTGCVMIYNAEIAKDVFGTDDPSEIENITGAGSGKWDKFLAAADKLEAKGYAAVSGCNDLWNACDKSATTPWVVDGELKVDPKREEYFDLAKTIKEKGYSNGTRSWSEGWYSDMKGEGEKKVFAFFGPAWLINYVMIGNCGGNQRGEGTYGQWRVCAPPVGSFWGGSWLFANKDTDNKEGVAELLEWITLDTSETGLQYLWANGLIDWDNDPGTITAKDAVVSNTVMAKSDGSMDFCGGQNIYAAFIQGNNFASGKCMTEYDESISGYFTDMAEHYAAGEIDKKQALKDFIEVVKENICF